MKNGSDIEERIEDLKRKIGPSGKIWIAWSKSGKLGSKLNLDTGAKIVYPRGLVESMNLAIDETWTVLKFT